MYKNAKPFGFRNRSTKSSSDLIGEAQDSLLGRKGSKTPQQVTNAGMVIRRRRFRGQKMLEVVTPWASTSPNAASSLKALEQPRDRRKREKLPKALPFEARFEVTGTRKAHFTIPKSPKPRGNK
jgi:hypothetical protein